MYQLLLIVHFIALAMAIGGGYANIIAKRQMPKADPVTYPGFGIAAAGVGKMATLGLVILWITGLWMASIKFGGFTDIPALFWAKIAAVVAASGVSASLNVMIFKAQKSGTPTDSAKVDKHAYALAGLGLIIILLAVLTFS